MAGNMFDYPSEHILLGDYIHSNYDPALILKHLSGLTLENCLIFLGTDKAPAKNLMETYFLNAKFMTDFDCNFPKTQTQDNKCAPC